MKKIFKFVLERGVDKEEGWHIARNVPRGFEVLTVASGVERFMWAIIDPTAPSVDAMFQIVGTGWDLTDPSGDYVTTLFEGPFVWHVFYMGARP